jgi:hypothetical protein
MATVRVYLHDVSLMLVRVEGAHGGEGGAPGQYTWHTQCPFLINRNKLRHPIIVILWGMLNATPVFRASGHLSFITTADIASMEIGMFVETVG